MIRYNLECQKGHRFDAWFQNASAFDKQASRKLVTCPDCGSTKVTKSIMAPSVKTTKGKDAVTVSSGSPENDKVAAARREFFAAMRKLREAVESNAEYVGARFAEEARKIHYEEAEERGIYGEATLDEVQELVEEGIDCQPLPILPEDQN
jgi:hypothetical protein